MPDLPGASQSLSTNAGAQASGRNVLTLFAPVALNADGIPRIFGSASAIYAQHGYADAIEYAALHFEGPKTPIVFVGLPIDVPGVVSRLDTTGNGGSSAVTVTAGGSGVLGEHSGVLIVEQGGTVGTDQILLRLSLDGGRTSKRVRLGTAVSLALPYVGATLGFTVGTLVTGETIATWAGSGPRSAAADWATARAKLAEGQQGFRTILLIGDVQDATEANALGTQAAAYASANDRFIYARASIKDRLPLASIGSESRNMTGGPALTFEADDNSITRAAGSFLADGFALNDAATVAGSVSNNVSRFIDSIDAESIELTGAALTDESLGVGLGSIVASTGLVFANAGETITRSRGSWVADGFRAGDTVPITGTSGAVNDGSKTVATVTALVLTLTAGGVVADERIAASAVSISTGTSKAAWMAASTAAFATVDGNARIDLSAGRAYAPISPFSGWQLPRPASWAASLAEYTQPPQIAIWAKELGPLVGWDLLEPDQTLIQWDDRVDGEAATMARFTSFRSWGNGPGGAFLAYSSTRATEGSLLGPTHNQAVVDIFQTVIQLATENAVGRILEKNRDGTATEISLKAVDQYVQGEIEKAVLQEVAGRGRLASAGTWRASRTDLYNVPNAVMHGFGEVVVNGTIHRVETVTKVL